jgi:hypothetical protein
MQHHHLRTIDFQDLSVLPWPFDGAAAVSANSVASIRHRRSSVGKGKFRATEFQIVTARRDAKL